MFCRFCGAQVPENVNVCPACGRKLSEQSGITSAAAVGSAPEPAPAQGERIARMGDRFLSVVLDTVVTVAVFAVAGMALAGRLGGLTGSGFSLEGTPALITILATALITFCYLWLGEGLFGATLGKGMIGIQVRKKDGGDCDLRSSLIRNLARLIDAFAFYLVGFIVAMLSKSRQRVGDHLAGTVVFEKRVAGFLRTGLVVLWLLLCGGAFTGAWLLHDVPAGTPAAQAVEPAAAPVENTGYPAPDISPGVNLASSGALKAVNFDYLLSKDGASRPPGPYHAGDTVHVKYDVVGYSTDAGGHPKLSYHLVVLDPAGLPLNKAWTNVFRTRLREGAPVHGTFSLGIPGAVPAGTCTLVLDVRDELNGDELKLTAPFRVDAAQIAPATRLEVRGFQLSLSKGGPAVEIPVLRGGGTVYMDCSVFGALFRGDQADVQMGLKVTGPGGEVVFEKPDYEHIRGSWVYHPPTFHVPISGHMSVPSGFEKGVYTALYTFTDNYANRTITTEGRFRVE